MHYAYFTLEQREALKHLIQSSLAQPERTVALERLRSAGFGVCARCGSDIPFVRLAQDPRATLCRTCAS